MKIPSSTRMLVLSSAFAGAGLSLAIAVVVAAQTVVVPAPTYLGRLTPIPHEVTRPVVQKHVRTAPKHVKTR